MTVISAENIQLHMGDKSSPLTNPSGNLPEKHTGPDPGERGKYSSNERLDSIDTDLDYVIPDLERPNVGKNYHGSRGDGHFKTFSNMLEGLVAKSKGAVSNSMLQILKKFLPGTKVVFVMGQSGTGKTTILQELTGLDLKVGSTLSSGTLQYQVCPAVLDGEQYLFIDTGGFGAADLDNMSNFKDILSCVTTLGPIVTIAGVLFVYGQPKYRISVEDLRTVRWIECFCGPEFFANITVVTSQWDGHNEDGFEDAWDRLTSLEQNEDIRQILEPPGRYHGGSIYHHGLPDGRGSNKSHSLVLSYRRRAAERGDELRKLIRRQYSNSKPAKLQIVREIDRGTPFLDTQAAKVLGSDMHQTTIQIRDGEAILESLSEAYAIPNPQDPFLNLKQEQEGSSSSGKSQKPEGGSGIKRPEGKPKQQKSWLQRVMDWIFVGFEASSFFSEARKSGYQSGNRKGDQPAPAWNLWGAFRNWWSGWV